MEGELQEAINRIEFLAQSVGGVQLFVAAVANMSIAPEGSASEATHGDVPAKIEKLAYYLYPYFEHSGNLEINPWHVNECIELIDSIASLRLTGSIVRDSAAPNSTEVDLIASFARIQAEVVRGSAYPEQTAIEISSIQGHFDSWFANIVGISPTRAQELLWAIIRRQEDAFNSLMPEVRPKAEAARGEWRSINDKRPSQRTATDIKALEVFKDEAAAGVFAGMAALIPLVIQDMPVGRRDLSNLESPPTVEEWDSLINLVGMRPDDRSKMSAPVDVRSRPLFVMPDNRTILVDISNGLDVLWESFERIAKSDQDFFQTYQKRKADRLESMVTDCLSSLLSVRSIYRNLTYPDPDKPEGSTAELDAAVLWGPFLILVECKSSQFRWESQLGDIGRLRSDIGANVEDAFDQAKRAAKYVNDTTAPLFTERISGRHLAVNKDSILRTYLITVSLQQLAGLATRLSTFQALGLFEDGEYPFSISVADLETVARFCDGLDVFLHYIEKRLLVQAEPLGIVGDELDLFGAYLKTRLQASRLWDREDVKPNMMVLSGFSAQFDDWFNYKRGNLSTVPSIALDVPVEILGLLSELRERPDDSGRWIAFTLLDLSDRVLDVIARGIADLKTAGFTPGMFRRLVRVEGDAVISILASRDIPRDLLQQRTQTRAVIEKYRYKAKKSIAFGITTTEPAQTFDCACWIDEEWRQDADIEELISHEPPFVPAPNTKSPGRNSPCLCGSGKKFKKCCLPRFEGGRAELRSHKLE